MVPEPNYLTVAELEEVLKLLNGLNEVSISQIFIDEVTVRDANGDSLGRIAYREPGYVFVPGDLDAEDNNA